MNDYIDVTELPGAVMVIENPRNPDAVVVAASRGAYQAMGGNPVGHRIDEFVPMGRTEYHQEERAMFEGSRPLNDGLILPMVRIDGLSLQVIIGVSLSADPRWGYVIVTDITATVEDLGRSKGQASEALDRLRALEGSRLKQLSAFTRVVLWIASTIAGIYVVAIVALTVGMFEVTGGEIVSLTLAVVAAVSGLAGAGLFAQQSQSQGESDD